MSRRDEVEEKIESICWVNDWEGDALALRVLCRTLADEVDTWRNAVVDAAIVNWTYTAEDEKNPYLAVCKLLACAAQEALDPAISLEAKKLHDRIAELEGRS